MKITGTDILGFILILIMACGMFYLVLFMSDRDARIEKCLKPFAEEYCSSRDMILKSNNDVTFFCADDMRSPSQRYNYLIEEREGCRSDALHAVSEQEEGK